MFDEVVSDLTHQVGEAPERIGLSVLCNIVTRWLLSPIIMVTMVTYAGLELNSRGLPFLWAILSLF